MRRSQGVDRGWPLFVVTGVAMFLAGAAHPRPIDDSLSFDEMLAWMVSQPTWRLGHVPGLLAMMLIGACVVRLARSDRLQVPPMLITFTGIASVLAVIEMVVHIFVDADAVAFTRGDTTPLMDLHFFLQAFYMPIFGVSFAVLALWGAKHSRLTHPIFAVLAAAGSLAFGIVGPAGAVYQSTKLGMLFIGVQGLSLWFVAIGITQAVRQRRSSARGEATDTAATA